MNDVPQKEGTEMDQATRRARARAKQQARKNADGLSIGLMAPRGLGRKSKPSEVFPIRQCDYVIDGREVLIRKRRNNPRPGQSETYFVAIVKGGHRCVKNELTNGRCLEHMGATYAKDE